MCIKQLPLKGHEVDQDVVSVLWELTVQGRKQGPPLGIKSSWDSMSASMETERKQQVMSEKLEVNSEEGALGQLSWSLMVKGRRGRWHGSLVFKVEGISTSMDGRA